VNGSSYSQPALVHSLPYRREQYGDMRVWDTRGVQQFETDGGTVGDATVGDASVGTEILLWAKCFSPQREYSGEVVVDTGRLRVRISNDRTVLRAERWTDAETWSRVPLGDSSWTLTDADIRRIGQVRVSIRLNFTDAESGATYNLDAYLHRGLDVAQFIRAPRETTATPSGLQDLLAPIAGGDDQTPAAGLGIRLRSGVNA